MCHYKQPIRFCNRCVEIIERNQIIFLSSFYRTVWSQLTSGECYLLDKGITVTNLKGVCDQFAISGHFEK